MELLRKRLLYQSQHCGMREMDLLVGHFAERHIPSMSEEELKKFEVLLALPDDDLYGSSFELLSEFLKSFASIDSPYPISVK